MKKVVCFDRQWCSEMSHIILKKKYIKEILITHKFIQILRGMSFCHFHLGLDIFQAAVK